MLWFGALLLSSWLWLSMEVVTAQVIIHHDEVVPIAQNVVHGDQQFDYAPLLNIDSGCQIYPAVDAQGRLTGGLHAAGSDTGKCDDSTRGQVYSRMSPLTVTTVIAAFQMTKGG